ncbi:MAG: aminopeptidase P family protein [Candidatus Heimdallarchaeota archaeon]|nr:aminopeptidase P family protein [Candidatus Heimdallarchaeota archaeon]MBY8994532.1 aminopeptidase P family protein [Candidatus Heimdallarchaeota archaeon]
MRPITQEKMDKLTNFMEKNSIDLIFITDWGNARDVNMRYLTGHIMDANLIVTSGGETILLPWDVDLAEDHAQVDTLVTDQDSRHNPATYVKEAAKKDSPVVGFNLGIPYRYILEIQRAIPNVKLFENPHTLADMFTELRSTKSPQEMEKLQKAGKIGNKTINDIRKFAEENEGTENDLSFLVMKKMQEYGAEENSFPSLVANVARSHMIHCHPAAGNNKYSENGLALIDYGARHDGYVCDITIPLSFGKLTEEQKKIKKTCFKAYEEAIAAIDVGVPLWKISEAAVDVIEAAGYHMPHGLGHGLGLTVHDAPGIRQKPTEPERLEVWNETLVEDGMVFTIEPGVYVKGLGGQRLENDVMIRNGRVEVYTKSEPIEL